MRPKSRSELRRLNVLRGRPVNEGMDEFIEGVADPEGGDEIPVESNPTTSPDLQDLIERGEVPFVVLDGPPIEVHLLWETYSAEHVTHLIEELWKYLNTPS